MVRWESVVISLIGALSGAKVDGLRAVVTD